MFCFFFQAEDGIRDVAVTGVQTCALPISGTATCGRVNWHLDGMRSDGRPVRGTEPNGPILQGICRRPVRILGAMSHTTSRRSEPHEYAHVHGHDHDQGGWWRRVWHGLREAVGEHSHDAAD